MTIFSLKATSPNVLIIPNGKIDLILMFGEFVTPLFLNIVLNEIFLHHKYQC